MKYKTEYHITPSQLKDIVSYDPSTGKFRWLEREELTRADKTFNTVFAGQVAGGVSEGHGKGYLRIKIYGKMLKAHRMAFAYMNGEWPEGYVDHIDGDIQNNKWDNLRITDKKGNARNRRISDRNTSGVLGVSWCERDQVWLAQIGTFGQEGRTRRIGCFKKKQDAIEARRKAEVEEGYHKNHGKR